MKEFLKGILLGAVTFGPVVIGWALWNHHFFPANARIQWLVEYMQAPLFPFH